MIASSDRDEQHRSSDPPHSRVRGNRRTAALFLPCGTASARDKPAHRCRLLKPAWDQALSVAIATRTRTHSIGRPSAMPCSVYPRPRQRRLSCHCQRKLAVAHGRRRDVACWREEAAACPFARAANGLLFSDRTRAEPPGTFQCAGVNFFLHSCTRSYDELQMVSVKL